MRLTLPRNRTNYPARTLAGCVAAMALRECAFLDKLWLNRCPTRCDALIKRRHKQFMTELTAFYCCACEDYLESNSLMKIDRFMELVADEVARSATEDRFITRPPYFRSDAVEHRRKRYAARIDQSRCKLKFIPSHLRIEWMAARTALELRQILRDRKDDPNELNVIECRLAERLEWTAAELTG